MTTIAASQSISAEEALELLTAFGNNRKTKWQITFAQIQSRLAKGEKQFVIQNPHEETSPGNCSTVAFQWNKNLESENSAYRVRYLKEKNAFLVVPKAMYEKVLGVRSK